MIIYGWGSDRVEVRALPHYICPACGHHAPGSVQCVYYYGHIYWLFSFTVRRQYYQVCHGCGQAAELLRRDAEEQFGKARIPFYRRTAVPCVIVASILIFTVPFLTKQAGGQNRRVPVQPVAANPQLAVPPLPVEDNQHRLNQERAEEILRNARDMAGPGEADGWPGMNRPNWEPPRFHHNPADRLQELQDRSGQMRDRAQQMREQLRREREERNRNRFNRDF